MQKLKKTIYHFLLSTLYSQTPFLIIKHKLKNFFGSTTFINKRFFKLQLIFLKYPCEFLFFSNFDTFQNQISSFFKRECVTDLFYVKYKNFCYQANLNLFTHGKQIYLFLLTFFFYKN
jgi:hypothetical protein